MIQDFDGVRLNEGPRFLGRGVGISLRASFYSAHVLESLVV